MSFSLYALGFNEQHTGSTGGGKEGSGVVVIVVVGTIVGALVVVVVVVDAALVEVAGTVLEGKVVVM